MAPVTTSKALVTTSDALIALFRLSRFNLFAYGILSVPVLIRTQLNAYDFATGAKFHRRMQQRCSESTSIPISETRTLHRPTRARRRLNRLESGVLCVQATSILTLNEHLQINNMEFQALESPKEGGKKQFVAQVMAAEPVPPEIGLVDLNTVAAWIAIEQLVPNRKKERQGMALPSDP